MKKRVSQIAIAIAIIAASVALAYGMGRLLPLGGPGGPQFPPRPVTPN